MDTNTTNILRYLDDDLEQVMIGTFINNPSETSVVKEEKIKQLLFNSQSILNRSLVNKLFDTTNNTNIYDKFLDIKSHLKVKIRLIPLGIPVESNDESSSDSDSSTSSSENSYYPDSVLADYFSSKYDNSDWFQYINIDPFLKFCSQYNKSLLLKKSYINELESSYDNNILTDFNQDVFFQSLESLNTSLNSIDLGYFFMPCLRSFIFYKK